MVDSAQFPYAQTILINKSRKISSLAGRYLEPAARGWSYKAEGRPCLTKGLRHRVKSQLLLYVHITLSLDHFGSSPHNTRPLCPCCLSEDTLLACITAIHSHSTLASGQHWKTTHGPIWSFSGEKKCNAIHSLKFGNACIFDARQC